MHLTFVKLIAAVAAWAIVTANANPLPANVGEDIMNKLNEMAEVTAATTDPAQMKILGVNTNPTAEELKNSKMTGGTTVDATGKWQTGTNGRDPAQKYDRAEAAAAIAGCLQHDGEKRKPEWYRFEITSVNAPGQKDPNNPNSFTGNVVGVMRRPDGTVIPFNIHCNTLRRREWHEETEQESDPMRKLWRRAVAKDCKQRVSNMNQEMKSKSVMRADGTLDATLAAAKKGKVSLAQTNKERVLGGKKALQLGKGDTKAASKWVTDPVTGEYKKVSAAPSSSKEVPKIPKVAGKTAPKGGEKSAKGKKGPAGVAKAKKSAAEGKVASKGKGGQKKGDAKKITPKSATKKKAGKVPKSPTPKVATPKKAIRPKKEAPKGKVPKSVTSKRATKAAGPKGSAPKAKVPKTTAPKRSAPQKPVQRKPATSKKGRK
ncbi:hypothetical protein BC829DRAFT_423843 [Chytridium lagenaria]|nr:hypothetical protein BC829DRAFT_423843 [Chytridium lagenaria]